MKKTSLGKVDPAKKGIFIDVEIFFGIIFILVSTFFIFVKPFSVVIRLFYVQAWTTESSLELVSKCFALQPKQSLT